MSAGAVGRNRATALVGVVALCAAGACSSNAFIKRRRELPVEAEIVGGSPNNVFVRDSGGDATIERIDIADVDHPGTGLMIVAPFIALGFLFPIFPSIGDCGMKGFGSCMGAFLPFALGGATFVWGATTYAGSVAALKDRSRSDSGARMDGRGLPRVRITKRPIAPETEDDPENAPDAATQPSGEPPPAASQPVPALDPASPAAGSSRP